MKTILASLLALLLLICANAYPDLLTDNALEYRDKGFQAQRQGDFDKALEFYQKSIQVNPKMAVTHNDIGVLYETKGQYELAEKSYFTAIKTDPQFASAYYNLACLYENKGDYHKALEYFNKRVGLGPQSSLWVKKSQDKINEIEAIINPPAEQTKIIEEQIEEQTEEQTEVEEQFAEEQFVIEQQEVVKSIVIEEEAVPEVTVIEREVIDPHLERAQRAYKEKDYFTTEVEANKSLQLDPYNQEAEDLLREVHRKFLVD